MSAAEAEHSAGAARHAKGHGGGRSGGHGGGHGGGSHEEHEGAPEWLISFADNVMLQMGFFVILLGIALKTAAGGGGEGEPGGAQAGTPSDAQLDAAIAIREAFNNPVSIDSTELNDLLLVQRLRQRNAAGDASSKGLDGGDRRVQSVRPSGYYGAGGGILFDSGVSEPNAEAQAAVVVLSEKFRGTKVVLTLRGHCSAAEAAQHDDRGMQLSYDRAMAIGRALAVEGIDWSRLRLMACADNERLNVTTYEEDGHRGNQRVEVVEGEPDTNRQ